MTTQFRDVEQFVTELQRVGDTTTTPEPNAALCAVLEGGRMPRAATVAAPRRRWLRPIVLPATVGTVLFGGLAAAGALPAPVQRATAGFVAHVGVSIPGRAAGAHAPASVPAPSVRAGGDASTRNDAPAAAWPASPSSSRTTKHVPNASRTPATADTTGRGQHGTGPLPVTPPKLVPPTIPNLTVPTLPPPTVPTVPPVTVPGLP